METEILVWMILMISEVTETCAMMTLGLIMILVATEILAGLKEETTEVMAFKENLTLEGVEVMTTEMTLSIKEDMITRPFKYPLDKTRRSPFQ